MEVSEAASVGCPFAIVATVVAVVTCVAVEALLVVLTLNCQLVAPAFAALLSDT